MKKFEHAMQLLSKQTLSLLNAGLSYNRQAVQPGILHFSVGNFHRAHQASYYNDLLASLDKSGEELKWGILGASVREGGSYTDETRPELADQDFLYTLVESNNDSKTPQVIGSIIECLPYAEDHQPIKKALCDDAIKIVSMTVTEGRSADDWHTLLS